MRITLIFYQKKKIFLEAKSQVTIHKVEVKALWFHVFAQFCTKLAKVLLNWLPSRSYFWVNISTETYVDCTIWQLFLAESVISILTWLNSGFCCINMAINIGQYCGEVLCGVSSSLSSYKHTTYSGITLGLRRRHSDVHNTKLHYLLELDGSF